ncbi:SRSX-21 protein [Aphelenchoides avenae]|nr:SRSX-21 protein [Aphelenchus avenae]
MEANVDWVQYYEHGFYTDMFLVNFVLFVTGAIATVMNVFLLYITVKHKSLHHTYNHLLAITALCDSLHCFSFVVGFYNSVIGRNLVRLLTCYYMQMFAVIAWCMSVSLLLIIAVDRLIAILWPVWHRNAKQWWYIAVLCTPGVAFTAWIVVVSYRFALDDSEHLVFCMYSACFLDYVGTLMFRSCAVLNGLTIACYVAIWLAMKQMKSE